MRFFTTAISLLALVGITIALTIEKYQGPTTGNFIVLLNDGISKASILSDIKKGNGLITHDWTLINGFSGRFDTVLLNTILDHPGVKSVTEDGIMTVSSLQTNVPWGLQRISDRSTLKGRDPSADTFTYTYSDDRLGEGVDIYIVDTGIRTTHTAFGGRAELGYVAPTYPKNEDGNGHGTHVAGTAAGCQFGVAQRAKLIAVKVMSDEGSGSVSDIVSGLDWVQQRAKDTKRPSVVNMSLGGLMNIALDGAVDKLTTSDPPVHVVVAAGNSNADASVFSPARARTALTVGASDINDARASFSNFGRPVKVFAPGVAVQSAWSTSDTATNRISGTSMATPHITGLVAYLLAQENIRPDDMIKKVQHYALKGKLSGIPPLTENLLAQNRKHT